MVIIMAIPAFSAPQGEDADWPRKPITAVIQYGEGGGTDTMTRGYAAGMEEALDTTVNAINQPGATGSVALDFVWAKPADGYWWLGGSQFNKSLRVLGLTDTSWRDWQYFRAATALQAWSVRPDSPLQDFGDLVEAARAEPGKYTVSNSGVGGIWFEGNALMMQTADIEVEQVSYSGGAAGVMAGLQGEVDVIGNGLHEQIEFIRSGELRCLAVFTGEPIELDSGEVLRPVTDFVPELEAFLPFASQYTLAVKKDIPVEILEKIEEAFVAAVNRPEYENLLEERFFFKDIAVGEDADRSAALAESITSWLLWDLQVPSAKVNPADLGIPRPEDFAEWWPPEDYEPVLD